MVFFGKSGEKIVVAKKMNIAGDGDDFTGTDSGIDGVD